jgi:cell division protein DivIC
VFLRRFIVAVYLLIFISVAVASTTFFVQTRAEYLQLKEVQRVTTERLAMARTRLQEQEEILRRLREDPAYVEMVIRRRLGYAKPDEQIFRFEPSRRIQP